MDFQSFASSSAGNLYRVKSGQNVLLIECGLPMRRIREALAFELAAVSGCLLTHEHMDHAKSATEMMKAGIDLYTSAGTAEALSLTGHRLHTVKAGEQFRVGCFNVLPFATQHDAAEPLGFLLSDGTDKLMFATDTHYLKWRFKGLTLIAVECNYADDLIVNLEPCRKRRLVGSHMSLATTKAMLRANDLSRVREIHLLHLSSGNSDATRFKTEIEAMTGRPVYVEQQ